MQSPSIRSDVVNALTHDPKQFGLAMKQKSTVWTRLFSKVVYSWPDGDDPDTDELIAGAGKVLAQLRDRLTGVPDALRPIYKQSVGLAG